MTLVLLGQWLELRARHQTGAALRDLLKLAPRTARRLDSIGTETDVEISVLRPGDHIRVRPGERVAVDGIILDGSSTLDESLVTGESMPVDKHANDTVTAGTLNGNGSFRMVAAQVGQDTVLARIVTMVSAAQRTRAPVQSSADKVAAVFVPTVILIAILSAVLWVLWGPPPRVAHGVLSAISVLVIACPCALGLATPMSVMVSMGRATQFGLLFRNAEAIELLHKVDTVIFDKTGTLTKGRPEVVFVRATSGRSEAQLLTLAAGLEARSEHSLAVAILTEASTRNLDIPDVSDFIARPGLGVTGTIKGHRCALGNEALMRAENVAGDWLHDAVEQQRERGRTVTYVAQGGLMAGFIAIADPIRDTAIHAINSLRDDGIRIIMVTGDNHATASAVARQLTIDEIAAGVLPAGKADLVRRLRGAGRIVAMVGDGINDAPALALADVGIAMASGADIAIECAGVTVLNGDLASIVHARSLSQLTMRNIRQNLFFAFAYNAIGIPLAAGFLYPITGWTLSPMFAAAAMSLSSVSVIANSLRLRRQEVK